MNIEKGNTVILGLCSRQSFATISDDTFSALCSVMDLNTCFKQLLNSNMLHCKWNAIQVINVASFIELTDTTLRGRIVNISVGLDSARSFSVRGAVHSADGNIAVCSSKEVVKC